AGGVQGLFCGRCLANGQECSSTQPCCDTLATCDSTTGNVCCRREQSTCTGTGQCCRETHCIDGSCQRCGDEGRACCPSTESEQPCTSDLLRCDGGICRRWCGRVAGDTCCPTHESGTTGCRSGYCGTGNIC